MKNILIIISFLGVLSIGYIRIKLVSIEDVKISDWGPRDTEHGKSFNVQPNNKSAMWINAKGLVNHTKTYVYFGDRIIHNESLSITNEGVTFYVDDSLYSESGTFLISIVDGATKSKILVGNFQCK